jgi:4-alpha-glucanotransferase
LLLQEWFAASEHWVVPYATFCFLRDLFGTAEHWRWGVMAKPSKQLLADITSPQKEWHNSILCCYWLQYQLHRQLRQVGDRREAAAVLLHICMSFMHHPAVRCNVDCAKADAVLLLLLLPGV